MSADDTVILVQAISSCPGVVSVERDGDILKLQIDDAWSVAAINTYLVEHKVAVNYIQQKRSSLEEKFLEILKESDQSLSTLHNQSVS